MSDKKKEIAQNIKDIKDIIKQKLETMVGLIDKKQVEFIDSLKKNIQSWKSDEDIFIQDNQNVIENCIRTGVIYYFGIKQIDRLANCIVSLIKEQYLTVETCQKILTMLYNNIIIEIISSHKSILILSARIIHATIPFKLETKYVIENIKLLIDFYSLSTPNYPTEHSLNNIIQGYITSLFKSYSVETNLPNGCEPKPLQAISPLFISSQYTTSNRNGNFNNKPLSVSPMETSTPFDESDNSQQYHEDELQQPVDEKPIEEQTIQTLESPNTLTKSNEDESFDEFIQSSEEIKKEEVKEIINEDNQINPEQIKVENEINELKKWIDDEDKKDDLYEKQLPPHYAILSVLTKISLIDHAKRFVISDTLLKGNYKQMTGKRPMTLTMQRIVLDLIEFWLSQCPSEFCPNSIKGWKQDLCKCIAHNTFSNEEPIFITSVKIFSLIIHRFRMYFKKEIEIITKHIYFFFIKSPLPFISHKLFLVNEMQKLATQPQIIIDLFTNYDCMTFGMNLFEEFMSLISFILSSQFKMETPDELSSKIIEIRRAAYKIIQSVIESIQMQIQSMQKLEEKGIVEIINSVPVQSHCQEGIELLKQRKRKVDVIYAKQLFKNKPNDGVAYMIKTDLCSNSPDSIAQFLMRLEGIDKTALGKYLTSNKDLNKEVFKEYMKLIDFTGLNIDEALRTMFNLFVMPGEGQVVDRVIEMFSIRYAECMNEKINELNITSNQIYFLATTIIFLSTETHNANVKTRTMDTYEKFKGMVEQFNFTLPDDYLQPLYQSVTQNAFLIPEHQNEEKSNEKLLIAMVKANPIKREEVLAVSSGFEKVINDISLSKEVAPISIVNKDILKSLVETLIPLALKTLKIAFEEYKTVHDVIKNMNILISISANLELDTSITLIIKMLCEWGLFYHPNNKNQGNIEMTKVVIDLAMERKEKIGEGWKYIFTLLSRIEQVLLTEQVALSPLVNVPKNTRKLFFMNVQHRLYQPKENKVPVISLTEINSKKKELKKWIDKAKEIFKQLINCEEDEITTIYQCLCEAGIEELNYLTPSMFLMKKMGYITYERKVKNNKEFNIQTVNIIKEFLLQCGLHPHENVAKEAIKMIFSFNENNVFGESSELLKEIVIIMCDSPLNSCRITILDMLKECVDKNSSFIQMCWKEIFEILYIASLDEDIAVIKSGYMLLKYVNEKKIQFDRKYDYYYLKTMVRYSLVTDRYLTQEKSSHPFILASIQSILKNRIPEGVDLSFGSSYNELFFNVLVSYAHATSSQYIEVASVSLQTINHIIDDYMDKLTFEDWYYIFHRVYFKILESIGYYHCKVITINNNNKSCEWLTSVALNLMLQMSGLISQHPDKLGYFICDYIYIITTFITKGTEFITQIGLLSLKDIIPIFIEHPQYLKIYEMMNNDIINYFFDAVQSFTLQQGSVIDEIEKKEKELDNNQTEEIICSCCKKPVQQFELVECPFCSLKFCSLECKEKMNNQHQHKIIMKTNIEDQFIGHKFELTRLDIPFIATTFKKYIDTLYEFAPKIILLSQKEDEELLKCFLFNIERLLNMVIQIKTDSPYLKYINDVTIAVQTILIFYAQEIFKIYPSVIVHLLDKFLHLPSNFILHVVFDLLNTCSDDLLMEIYTTHLSSLYKLILSEEQDIRKSLYNLLMRIKLLVNEPKTT
ncbi:guanyl-nucleotide exchange factor, putative [Entamoeba histolytica HM-3:IMSS]|uniref:Guanylnucleotide exchange factor, putative n=2 Tax=Entamoeba histolytica TaxID=5759 RepID=M2R5K3_ENTHI|nr:guanylnucleotide exchange factor, putative [Entamoeba histolytica KU27]EMS14066.1 guanyl-nucleotide exchange factor, putative [Entamoeba histolytica HM-3:IMSS]